MTLVVEARGNYPCRRGSSVNRAISELAAYLGINIARAEVSAAHRWSDWAWILR